MLKGKVIREHNEYSVKVGAVSVDITADVRTLIATQVALAVAEKEQAMHAERLKYADAVKRYYDIAQIVLAGGTGMPTG